MVEKFLIAYLSKNNMLNIFKNKEKDDLYYRLLDIQLKLEHQQKQVDELREIVLALAKDINSLQTEINYLNNERYGKGL